MVTTAPTFSKSLLPSVPGFSGHQTFALRGGWLKKGMDALCDDPQIFSRPDALVTLGVGKNMVVAIRHWLLATRLARVEAGVLQPTALGLALLGDDGFDPYLEDPASLWLLHWNLCAPGSEVFSWAWTFNYWREWEWTRENLSNALLGAAASASAKSPSRETVERDVGVLLQTYAPEARSQNKAQNSEDGLDCPLRDLGLIEPGFEHSYRFAIGRKSSLSPAVFVWALSQFWNWKFPLAQTLPAREVMYVEGSPGLIFKLDEDSVLEYFDALENLTNGAIHFEDTPLVRQLVLTQPLNFESLLQAVFD